MSFAPELVRKANVLASSVPQPTGHRAKAAQMVFTFSLSCTSAACERVFSRVDAMYGRDQLCVLGDQLQAAGSDAAVQHEALGGVG